MGWMQAAAIGTSLFGAFSGRAAAKRNQEYQFYDMLARERDRQAKRRLASVNVNLAGQSFAERARENIRIREREALDQLKANELQRYMRAGDTRNEERLLFDREQTRERQIMADAAAERKRREDMEDFARREGIAEDEQRLFFDLLEQEQAFATREREDEEKAISEGRSQLMREYRERTAQRNRNQRLREQEARAEAGRLQGIRDQNQNVRNLLTRIVNEHGNIQTPDYEGRAEIEERADRYADSDIALLNQMAERATSAGDAELIRRGIDGSNTISSEQKAAILAKLAPQLSAARNEATQRAIGETEAINAIKTARFQDLRTNLEDALANAGLAGTTGLELDARLAAEPTSIYEKDVGSAYNPYAYQAPRTSVTGQRSPIGFTSRDIGLRNLGMGMAPYMKPDGWQYGVTSQSNRLNDMYSPDLSDPDSYMTGLKDYYDNTYNEDMYARNASSAMGASGRGFARAWEQFQDTDLYDKLDDFSFRNTWDKWKNRNNTPSSPKQYRV